ncbi:MAG TPA: tetratricopeptide repeat protein [Myxococcota bacterium]|nr:tetratricopeptide repeat protein [Myxococcota bacterium]HRY96437.1 tetratricopeptide repeat protein [Myxococcota bacterium]HSA23348.1 tetratricopeptide repeat protein [Myxococcota bacterium]
MGPADRIRELLDQGLAAYGLGRLDEARRAWSEALALEPGNPRAQEYLRFLEDSWSPGQEREGADYRPDVGSDPAVPDPAAAPAPAATPPAGEPAKVPLASDQPTLRPRPLSKSIPPPAGPPGEPPPAAAPPPPAGEDFVPPSRPAVSASNWGDLYDWGADGAPPQTPAPAGAVPVVQPNIVLEPLPVPPPVRAAPARPVSAISAVVSTPPPPQAEVRVATPLPPLPSLPPAAPGPVPATRPPTPAQPSQPPPSAPVVAAQHSSAWTVLTPPPIPPEEEGAFTRPPTLDDIPPLGPARPDAAISSPLGLVAGAPAPAGPADDDPGALIRGARDLLELDDFSGVLELVEKVLMLAPDHQEALFLREQATQELVRMYSSKVGELGRVPRVRMAEDEIIWLNLDHRAGFVLSLIDGHTSFDDVLSICGLPSLDALRILTQLLQEKVIEVD